MPGEIRLEKNVAAALLEHARRNPAEECAGLLAGAGGAITRAFPARNASDRPASAYEIAPEELFRLMRQIRAAGLEFLGIYHSHPAGHNAPSARDIERAYYPEAAYFILSTRADAINPIRAFSIRDGRVAELAIETR